MHDEGPLDGISKAQEQKRLISSVNAFPGFLHPEESISSQASSLGGIAGLAREESLLLRGRVAVVGELLRFGVVVGKPGLCC